MSNWNTDPLTLVITQAWLCPKCSVGTMVYTGEAWMTTNPGYHHACANCGHYTAIHDHQFPLCGRKVISDPVGTRLKDPKELVN